MTCTLNYWFHNSSEQFTNKQCILYVTKSSQTSIEYGCMKQAILGIMAVFDEFGISKYKNRFIGIIGKGLSAATIALSIAIMDSGNAFVFLDKSSATPRLDLLSHLKLIYFVDERYPENTSSQSTHSSKKLLKTFQVFGTDYNLWECISNEDYSSPECQFAFAVTSSGSTGDPKIIKVQHESILSNIIDLKEIYQLHSNDIILVTTPFTFDPCILDVFLAFYSGASILLPSNDIKFDSNFLSKSFTSNKYSATVWFTTPSLFMKCYPKKIDQCSLKILTFGGEQFPNLNSDEWPSLRTVKVYNIYGITEVSCWASIQLVDDFNKTVPLGTVLSNTIFEIRGSNNTSKTASDNVGELYIGSSRRKCLVNDDYDNFAQDLLFRPSGDLVKVVNGQYYYVGREDRRIKLYGHIIDLSAIENSILRNPFVKCCCCVFISNENKIIAFVELTKDDLQLNNLEKSLRTDLPPIMVPSNIYAKEIPINEHGKICEKSCKELYYKMKIQIKNLSTEFSNLWMRYTANEPTGYNSRGFVESGGNSILALQLTTALSEFSKVPKDLIAFLLSDKTYDECFQLIENEFKETSGNPKKTKISFSEVERIQFAHEESLPKPKKLKTLNLGKMLFIKSKNYQENCVPLESINQTSKINELKIKWKYNLDKCVDASPIIVVYENAVVAICGSHSGELVVLDLKSSDIILKIKLPDRIESSAAISKCGKFLFIGCYDKKLYCININENCVKWYYESNDIIKSTPVIFNNRIYFGSYDHNFYCISLETGILIWKTNVDDFSIYATPIVDEKIVVATLGGTIAILSHDGRIEHSHKYGKPFFSSPSKLPNKEECIIIDVTGVMRLFNMNSGYVVWEYQINGNVFSSISLIDTLGKRIIFGCHDRNIYCFEISNEAPRLIWKNELDSAIYSTPFGFENHSLSDNSCSYRHVVATSTSGEIYLMDCDTGNGVLNYSTYGSIFSSPVVHESYIVVGCRDNYLYCFEISWEV